MDNNERMLKMTIDGQELAITLYDTPTENALYDMFPMELNFEDFNVVERETTYRLLHHYTAKQQDG